ncbi:F-type H+-transporting ATPase subunit h [Entomortierella parvispora]|uniref:F-type H+-transporting ATPase subunit h n=1 Tax=Entomortierella parvispora TaxID=205924 RepID=A0A9P3LW34_9FUNG|nr:F-type H+-transporting ATPase subunit h [Entomortierella parvispora]
MFARLAIPAARAVAARPAVSFMAVRSFTAPSAPVMNDILKELYIKELKNYKPSQKDLVVDTSSIKDFKAPVAPLAPAFDAAAELSAWETANVEIAEAATEAVLEEEEEEEVEEEEEDSHAH